MKNVGLDIQGCKRHNYGMGVLSTIKYATEKVDRAAPLVVRPHEKRSGSLCRHPQRRQLFDSGLSMTEIARLEGVTRQAVHSCLWKHHGHAVAARKRHRKIARGVGRAAVAAAKQAARVTHFWERVDRSGGEDACWLWIECRMPAPYNYGHLCWRLRDNEYAHRVAWSLTTGKPIPRGRGKDFIYILHHCDNPPCCNPKHLYAGTPLNNMRDRDERGRNGKLGQRKKVCLRGHDRTNPDNIYLATRKSGPKKGQVTRSCRPCYQERYRERKRKDTAQKTGASPMRLSGGSREGEPV